MNKNLLNLILLLLTTVSNFANSQVYYSENFESGNGTSWKYSDLDGDGYKFQILNASAISSDFGTKSLVSYSYSSSAGALSPDNLVTSTAITLPSDASNIFLTYSIASYPGAYGSEHYAVYLTPTDEASEVITTTPVKEETLPYEGGVATRTVDVSSFKGQTLYLSFRHYNCTDMYFFIVDNISLKSLSSNNATYNGGSLSKFIVKNSDNDIKINVKNNGSNPITSVEINWNDGEDHIATIPTSVEVGESTTVTHPTKVNYSEITKKTITVAITKVNGETDSDTSDNSGSLSTQVTSQVVPKKVVIEEGTGTWCGWCVRGIVALKKLEENYPDDQVSIAVHNGDPMKVTEYDNGAGFSSFPGMTVDRELKGEDISPSTIGSYIESRKTIPTPVKLGGTYTISGDQMSVTTNAQFFSNFTDANFKLLAVVTENQVHGTASGYRQFNYYAGGSQGEMGGYENLPNPVPAAQMYYDHVGRALLGGYNGQTDSVPATITDGQTVEYTFNYTIPTAYNADNLHVSLLLIDGNDGTIVNATHLEKGELATSNISLNTSKVSIYPNPAKTDFNIRVAADGKYNITLFDMSGKLIANYGNISISGKTVNLPIKNLLPGKYFVNISQDGISTTKELLVK